MNDIKKKPRTINFIWAKLIISITLTTLLSFLLSYDFFPTYQIFLFLLFSISIISLIMTIGSWISIRKFPPKWLFFICTILVISMPLNYYYRNGGFWGKKIIEAAFLDDRSRIDLTLFENGHFLINSNWLLGDETFTGTYQLHGDTIEFDKFPVVNTDLISKKIIISGTKIYFAKNKLGNYDTTFYYFQIGFDK